MPRTRKKPKPPMDLEALDSVEWVVDVVVESFGTRVRVRSTDASAVTELLRRIPTDRVGQSVDDVQCVLSAIAEEDDCFGVYVGQDRFAQPQGLDEIAAALESTLSLFVAEHAPDRVFLHAGCVAWNGRAILVPGRSFSGKSTLVAAFLRAGATYYSDEYAVLDENGLVYPFPRLLSIRRADAALPAKVSHEAYSASVGVGPIEVACVVHTSYDSERAGRPWRPRRLTPGRLTLALLDNAVPARNRPDSTLRAIKRVAERASGLAGARGEADSVVAYLLERFEGFE
jgi:hypothetical protein